MLNLFDHFDKQIEIFTTALTSKMTLNEMAYLDVSYAPPFAPVWDPVLVAVAAAREAVKGFDFYCANY